MDKKVAKQIADNKLTEIISGDKSKLMKLLVESEHEFLKKYGIEYQIRTEAFYDDKEKNIIRVCASVDDQRFWSTLLPVSKSKLVNE